MTIRSHFVPRFYLTNFGTKLFCYDKTKQVVFQSTPANIALEKDFYGPTDEKKTNPIETALSGLEGKANIAISNIIKTKNYSKLSEEDKMNLCAFTAMQYLRTQEARWRVVQTMETLSNEITKQMGITDWEIKIKDEGKTGMHLDIMKEFGPIALVLRKMGVLVSTNNTEIPLWTSDNPVTPYNDHEQFPWGNLGIVSKGIELHLPLTSQLKITFYDPITYPGMPEMYALEKDNVIHANHLQTVWSTRFMYSDTDAFYMVNDYLSVSREAKNVDRPRLKPGIHTMKPEDFEGKKVHETPQFWLDPREIDRMREELEKQK